MSKNNVYTLIKNTLLLKMLIIFISLEHLDAIVGLLIGLIIHNGEILEIINNLPFH
jgi:hypothetical protein